MDHKTLLPTKRKLVFSILLSIIFTALTVLTILIDIVPIPEYIILEYLPLSNFLTFATLCFYFNAPKGFFIFFTIYLLIPIIMNCSVGFSFKKPKMIIIAYIICIIEIIFSLIARNIIPLIFNIMLLVFARLTVDHKKNELPPFYGSVEKI